MSTNMFDGHGVDVARGPCQFEHLHRATRSRVRTVSVGVTLTIDDKHPLGNSTIQSDLV